MTSEEIIALVKNTEQRNREGVATMTLAALRFVRDNSPKEWDALMASESGPAMASLWDYLRSMETPPCSV